MKTLTKIISIIILSSFSFAFAFHADITIDGLFDDWTPVKGYADDENDTFGGPGEFKVQDAKCEVQVDKNRYELSADLKSLDIVMESKIRTALLHYSAQGTVDWTMPAITYLVTMQRAGQVDKNVKLASKWGWIKNN